MSSIRQDVPEGGWIKIVGVITVAYAMALGPTLVAEGDTRPTVVAVFDSGQLRGRTDPLAEPLREGLRDNGCRVVVLTP